MSYTPHLNLPFSGSMSFCCISKWIPDWRSFRQATALRRNSGYRPISSERRGREREKQKERIENERRSCCSMELCLISRAQEVWVTHSKINTLEQWRAGTQRADGCAAGQKAGGGSMDPGRPATCGDLLGLTSTCWDVSRGKYVSLQLPDYISTLSSTFAHLCSVLKCFWFLALTLYLSFHIISPLVCVSSYVIWSQSTRAFQVLAVRDCTGLILVIPSQAFGLLHEALYCACLNVLIVQWTAHTFYTVLPCEGPSPSVIPLSSVPQTEGFWQQDRGWWRPRNKTTTVAMIDMKAALRRHNSYQIQGLGQQTHGLVIGRKESVVFHPLKQWARITGIKMGGALIVKV